MIETGLRLLYIALLSGLSIYGLLGLVTFVYYWRHRDDDLPAPAPAADPPAVTVQLPIYNERLVVPRLLRAAAALDYPPDRLQIQVIDDSDDDTADLAADLVAAYRRDGLDMVHVRRANRHGFKAGALAEALRASTGELVAIFDADFQPAPDFLRQTVPHFAADAGLGVIQTRWGHLNADASMLTGAQAIGIDKQFAVEQLVRDRAALFPKFNGTAGVWRRACIEDVGGWQADTVCEDLCLSTRAALRGWRFRFLRDVVAPAELPASISAFKNQQARWARGSLQCLLKFGRLILTDRSQRWQARGYALISMAAYANHLLLLLLLALVVPLVALDLRFSAGFSLYAIAGVGQPALFLLSQRTLYPDWRRRLRYLPTLLLVAVGLAPSNSRAVIGALSGGRFTFVRTPKGDALDPGRRYRLPFDWIVAVEILFALYAGIGVAFAAHHGNAGALFFLLTCVLGLGYVAVLSLRDALPQSIKEN